MQKFLPRSHVRIFHNECTRSTPFNPKLMFWCISYHLGAFGPIWLPYKTRWKTGRIVQNFVQRSHVRIFCNEHSQSTPLDPKHMVWCVSFRFGAFGTVSLLHESCYKTRQTGAINVKVRATKSCRNFSQRMLPIHTIGP